MILITEDAQQIHHHTFHLIAYLLKKKKSLSISTPIYKIYLF